MPYLGGSTAGLGRVRREHSLDMGGRLDCIRKGEEGRRRAPLAVYIWEEGCWIREGEEGGFAIFG